MKDLTVVSEFRLKLYPNDFYVVRAFYENELGYNVIHEWDRDVSKGVMFDVGGTVLELLWSTQGLHEPVVGADVSWEVSDVWQLFDSMKDKPYVIRGLKDNDWGDTSFHIQDPEGLCVTFFTKTEPKKKQ